MTRVLHRPRTDEALIPCAKRAPAAVGSLPPRDDTDLSDLPDAVAKEIDFSDILAETTAAAASPARRRLDHDSVLEVLAELRAGDAGIEENVAVILAMVAAAPFVRHEDAFTMTLAPVRALLGLPVPPVNLDRFADGYAEAETKAYQRIHKWLTDRTRELDAIRNTWLFAEHQAAVALTDALAPLTTELVDAYAANIRDLVAIGGAL